MATDYIAIGPTPWDEDCAQVGEKGFRLQADKETRAFVHQLERQFPDIPDGVYFKVKWFDHDFGQYPEVVIVYDDKTQDEVEFALEVEKNIPLKWDEEAKKELANANG